MLEQMPTYDTTTLAQLQAEGSGNNAIQFKILPSPQALSDRAVEALLGLHKRTDPNSLFYVRTVQRTDVQGIWGIIHSGLIENFAKGMAVQRGEAINTYQVSIPQDADERAPDTSSSFLGRLIHRKAAATSVYNIRERRMARNANLIVPGQQLIIVDFAPAELVAIYRHFVLRGGAQDTASESTQGRTLSEPTARMSY
jgi:hypothetical protein